MGGAPFGGCMNMSTTLSSETSQFLNQTTSAVSFNSHFRNMEDSLPIIQPNQEDVASKKQRVNRRGAKEETKTKKG